MAVNFIPGQYTPAGWDVNGDGKIDVSVRDVASIKRPRGSEVRTLNQYTGYFSSDEGDYPVSVVANSMKEAAKILTMPGVFGQDSVEPTMIKYVKSSIAVSVPVHQVGFNTFITPQGAIDSGAYATPAHSEVQNGTDVIFTASEPFGWTFDGWYKGDPENGGTLLSKAKVSTIDVYDAYSTLVDYYAKYTFNPTLRSGRYMDISRGWIVDIDFDGYATWPGRIRIKGKMTDYYFVMKELNVAEDGTGTMSIEADPTITQPESINAKLTFKPSYIGIDMVVSTITQDNSLTLKEPSTMNLKWVGEIE